MTNKAASRDCAPNRSAFRSSQADFSRSVDRSERGPALQIAPRFDFRRLVFSQLFWTGVRGLTRILCI